MLFTLCSSVFKHCESRFIINLSNQTKWHNAGFSAISYYWVWGTWLVQPQLHVLLPHVYSALEQNSELCNAPFFFANTGLHYCFIYPPVSATMPDTTDSTSKQTPDIPGTDVSSPPPYSYQGEQPPPYSGPEIYASPKTGQPATGYESLCDIIPSETTPIISSSSFDDRTVRRGFVRKVCVFSLVISNFKNITGVFTHS